MGRVRNQDNYSTSTKRDQTKRCNVKKTIYVPAYRKLVQDLRSARRDAGLSQTEVGRRIGKSRQFIHLYETAQSRMDVVQVCQIARLYGLKAHVLVRRLEEELSEEDDSSYVWQRWPSWVVRRWPLMPAGWPAPVKLMRVGHAPVRRPRLQQWRADPGAGRYLVRLSVRTLAFRPIKTGYGYRFEPCRRSQSVLGAEHAILPGIPGTSCASCSCPA
jgi:transcriptional regulator with XRE-family HTH domain